MKEEHLAPMADVIRRHKGDGLSFQPGLSGQAAEDKSTKEHHQHGYHHALDTVVCSSEALTRSSTIDATATIASSAPKLVTHLLLPLAFAALTHRNPDSTKLRPQPDRRAPKT